MMIKQTNAANYCHKGFLDDSSSMTSSTLTQRITRKKDQSLSSRRSISRNSSKSQDQSMDISKFYVKITSFKTQRKSDPVRPANLIKEQQGNKIKRRSPTPTVGFKRRQKQQDTISKNSDNQNIEEDIQLAFLQQKLSVERQAKEMVQRRLYLVQNELAIKIQKIEQLQVLNAELHQKQQKTHKRLQEYQKVATINESNFNQARQNLQKLRAIIKKNRLIEMQGENAKLKRQNYDLHYQLDRNKSQNQRNNQIIHTLEYQINVLNKQNQDLINNCQINDKIKEIEKLKKIIQTSKTKKQQELQKLVNDKSQQEAKLKLKIQRLQINLNYFNHKKMQEIGMLKQKQNKMLNKMRDKIININNQYSNLKIECQKLKKNASFTAVHVQRKNYMLSREKAYQDFSFDLSP